MISLALRSEQNAPSANARKGYLFFVVASGHTTVFKASRRCTNRCMMIRIRVSERPQRSVLRGILFGLRT